ncbi:carbamoyltransferase [Actinokineospora baliensis]|uniref:carbamoyltransferase family protein n=1 Tax=Actinokineospora baliensis TaxID=547056 RepID=UPI00195E4F16|nr:carbamoyltransferase C-terminal domain-containing protein [Actinokineospora baliensis]MBM7774417.1 carbamoyltransferase [Actinokineospora baliensis]
MSAPYVIGFSDSVHDRALCLFHGAEPVVAIEEERLTRLRHGLDFQGLDRHDAAVFTKLDLDGGSSAEHTARLRRMVDYCLSAAGVAESDVRLWIGNSLHTAFPLLDRAVYLNHHLAHAASAFYGSAAAEAAVLVLDGYGDATGQDAYEAVSIYRGDERGLTLLHQVSGRPDGIHLSESLGIFYRVGTVLSGFTVVDEGKAMGLAGYGTPRHLDRLLARMRFGESVVEIDNEGIWKDMREVPAASFAERADVAASFQAALERVMLFYARVARRLTGSDVLCVAGGVALNCLGNQRVLTESGFDDVFVFPAAADNGISLGAAYYGAHVILGQERTGGLATPCLGRAYARSDTAGALAEAGLDAEISDVGQDECARRAAAHLADGELVMWFQEGSEIGPRALGHRSVFGDPRSVDTRDHLNAAVKSREPFRPLAPIVLEEHVSEWFDCGRSPHMLFTPPVRPRTAELAPAVVHVDGTARVQTLAATDNPVVHLLLREFLGRTGVPLVINTSFNLRGEPIVETPLDAVTAFAESPVRVLCADGFHVVKHGLRR